MDPLPTYVHDLLGYLRIACEVGLLAFMLYSVLYFVRGTRADTILAGLTIAIIATGLLSRFLGLEVIEWLLMKVYTFLALSVLILFQPEIRRAFAELGSRQSKLRAQTGPKRETELIEELLEATFFLADRRIGALIAVEQDIGMRAYAETGTPIDAPVNAKLLSTLFFPNTPLHDGGTIISGNTVTAAGCIFPLTQAPELSKSLGTRHRAAVGVTEETDAVVIVVSEESGAVSLAHKGRLVRGIDPDRLKRHLTNYLVKKPMERSRRKRRRTRTLPALQPELQDDETVT